MASAAAQAGASRSPYQDQAESRRNDTRQTSAIGDSTSLTPTTASRAVSNQAAGLSTKHASLRQSQETVQLSGEDGKKNKSGIEASSKTQRLMQKSIESRDGRKGVEIVSGKSRERLMQQQNNQTPVGRDQKLVRAIATAATSTAYRHYNDSQNQVRMSAESHVSGISGILGNT